MVRCTCRSKGLRTKEAAGLSLPSHVMLFNFSNQFVMRLFGTRIHSPFSSSISIFIIQTRTDHISSSSLGLHDVLVNGSVRYSVQCIDAMNLFFAIFGLGWVAVILGM